MPLGVGFGASRFSSPSKAFRVLYAAENFPTAFAEAVVRDRYECELPPKRNPVLKRLRHLILFKKTIIAEVPNGADRDPA